jgi:predicted lipoprotein with Yx(FWY)xxD motif
MRTAFAFVVLPAVVLTLAGCGGSSSSSPSTSSAPATSSAAAPPTATSSSSTPPAASVKIASKTIPGLGPVLVNAQGHTLYIFAPDNQKRVTCVGPCASVWPPVKLAAGAKAVGSGAVKTSLLGSDSDPSGGRVVTYAGWPLYLYVADTTPASHAGQALTLNGGLWYVISPAGTVIKTKP